MTDRSGNAALAVLRGVRNVREFASEPVREDALAAILDVARLTGSAMNAQPWEFVVLDDRDRIEEVAAAGPNLSWLAGAPLVVCIVMAGKRPELERFDEGRVAERIMAAANSLGYGAGLGWFSGSAGMARGREILGVPEPMTTRTVVAIGRPTGERAPNPVERQPLADLVHRNRYERVDRK